MSRPRTASRCRSLALAGLALVLAAPALRAQCGTGGFGTQHVTDIIVKDGAQSGIPLPFPVEAIVPFEPYELYADCLSEYFVTDTNGSPVLTQLEPLAFWNGYRDTTGKRSLRLVRVVFMAQVPAGTTDGDGYPVRTYELKKGNPPNQTSPLGYQVVTWDIPGQNPSDLLVTTGPLQFRLTRSGFNLLDQVWLDTNSDGVYDTSELLVASASTNGAVMFKGAQQIPTSAQSEVKIKLVETGPVRFCARVDIPTGDIPGTSFDNIYGSRFYIYAYADQSHVDVTWSLRNARNYPTNGAGTHQGKVLAFKAAGVGFELEGIDSSSVVTYGTHQTTPYQSTIGGDAYSLRHAGVLEYDLVKNPDTGSETTPVSNSCGRAPGWADLTGDRGGLTIAVRHLSQQYPMALRIDPFGSTPGYGSDPRGIVAELFPAFQSSCDDPEISCTPDATRRHWEEDMQQKSHDLSLFFHDTGTPTNHMDRIAALNEKPPVCYVPYERICDTHAVFDMGGTARVSRQPADPTGEGVFSKRDIDEYVSGCNPDDAYYGWFDFLGEDQRRNQGSASGKPFAGHGINNQHPDTLYFFRAWARHGADIRPTHVDRFDIDTDGGRFYVGYHNDTTPFTWRTKGGTVEADPPVYPSGTVFKRWNPPDNQHFWFHHLWDVYAYTGDRVVGDALVHSGEMLRGALRYYSFGNMGATSGDLAGENGEAHRRLGHILYTCAMAYAISGDAAYGGELKDALDGFRLAQNPEWGFVSFDEVRSPACLLNEPAVKSWQLGYLARGLETALTEVHQPFTRMQTRAMIEGMGRLFTDRMWAYDLGRFLSDWPFVIGPQAGGSCYDFGGTATTSVMVDMPAWMYVKTGDTHYRDRVLDEMTYRGGGGLPWTGTHDFRLTDYVLGQDPTTRPQPAAVSGLQVQGTDLVWTVPNNAARYEIRWSTRELVESTTWPSWPAGRSGCIPDECSMPFVNVFVPNTEIHFWAAPILWDPNFLPGTPGNQETLDVSAVLNGQSSGTTVSFGVRYYDEEPWAVGDISMSELAVTSTVVP